MVAGSRSPSGARQSGKHNAENEKRSNRKPNKKTKLDIIDIDNELKQIENGIMSSSYILEPAPEPSRILKPRDQLSNVERVKVDRPKLPPSWYERQVAFTPSKSYVSKTRSKEEILNGESNSTEAKARSENDQVI